MKVSFIGLGNMGFPMAAQFTGFRSSSHCVLNRTKSKADELATRGAIAVGCPRRLAATVLLSSLCCQTTMLSKNSFSLTTNSSMHSCPILSTFA